MVFTLILLEALELLVSEKRYPPTPSATGPNGPVPSHDRGFTITLRHTTLGRNLWTSDRTVAETST
jgi:hypothetical protein